MARTIADQLVAQLVRRASDRLYGVVGDSLNPVVDAIRRNPRHRLDPGPARGDRRLRGRRRGPVTGRLAACAGSCGPGNLHLINGLYDAHRSMAPVLALASHIPSTEIGLGYFQETHPDQLFRECSHYSELISPRADAPAAPDRHPARRRPQRRQRRRPARGHRLPAAPASRRPWSPRGHRPSYRADDDGESTRRRDRRGGAGHPVLRQRHRGRARRGDRSSPSRVKSPVGHALRGKEWIQYDNPYDVGMSGLLGYGAAYEATHECDLLILLGTDFPYNAFLPDDVKIVQVDVRPEHLGRRSRLDLAVWGDVRETLRCAHPAGAPQDRPPLPRQDAEEARRRAGGRDQGVHPQGGQARPRSTPSTWPPCSTNSPRRRRVHRRHRHVQCVGGPLSLAQRPRAHHRLLRHGSMANALPQAIGAQFTDRDRQVVSMSGDGGFSMLMGDFLTLVQYDLPVKVVLFNNSSLGMVELEMLVAGLPSYGTTCAASTTAPSGPRSACMLSASRILASSSPARQLGLRA